jgi:hypothetical protein
MRFYTFIAIFVLLSDCLDIYGGFHHLPVNWAWSIGWPLIVTILIHAYLVPWFLWESRKKL